ncbi:SusC/RagA family TonB-linked outer membrane protein [Sphingobacterium sp. UT-1RO-CII-1]|uniref:SusC/RagA family TonB-linked outer membrane protein n=1 Tax=Sphingobacterium sp. UT-1RO-CII-1 TaxID=2995225 RepID=UPI00227C3433|nr:SusC/RagA family TonB-linked outer membrane protein [Sphingobacterium sp. UT-1RO-CII-1]MCY4778563.1 SusC/RagA family TonB-linked outer membrane protein [Sphingobacterium sp. UT-1RO-CII-1]
MKHFYEGGSALPDVEQRRTFRIQRKLKTFLNSFQCLLLSLSTIYYQFSCNVQKSRARGTTGYAVDRDNGGISVLKERLLRIARSDERSSVALLLTIFCVLFSSLAHTQATAQTQTELMLRGEVRSAADGQAIEGASIIVDKKYTRTDKEGKFTINVNKPTGVLTVKHIGYREQNVDYENTATLLKINLKISEKQIEEVEVLSTGYQKIPKERATGSFEFIDSALFNRKVSTDFVSRLEDVVPGISSTRVFPENKGRLLGINVRGISTLGSNAWPLVVVDGVPYTNNYDLLNGYFMNINPNDVESVTVLKDAAASSIWGAQSGNGVIVVTTKRAKYNQPFQLSFNSSLTVGAKPDLYYYPQMASADYIEAERFLFDKGYWNSRINRYNSGLTPVIQLLKKHKNNEIDDAELKRELDYLGTIDLRDDFLKYIYRNSTKQQYSVQLRGGSEKINTSFSLGYDKNLNEVVTSSYNRLTVKNNTQLRPIKNLTVDVGITYTESKRKESERPMGFNLMARGPGNYPYMRLADDNGNPLIVHAVPYNPTFRDTVAGGRLLDWQYRPLEELYETHEMADIKETFLNMQAAYQILPSIKVSGLYAYQFASQSTEVWKGMGSFYHRQYINYRAGWNEDEVIWNVPVGDMMNTLYRTNKMHQGRLQLDYNKDWSDKHSLNGIAGGEIRQVGSNMQSAVFFGYDPETLTHTPVEYGKEIRTLNGIGGSTRLEDFSQMESYTNRYVSYFANASYTYNGRYTLSGSARQDASNLFGVKTNDKFQPFWSMGLAWSLSKEDFIDDSVFPSLKLRATYGYNGNVNNNTAAYPIIRVESTPHYITGEPYAQMQSPPNPSLRWERVGMLNMGLDFNFKNRITGAVEYYIKRPKDLIAGAKLDPSTGYSTLAINSADLDGRGVDVALNTINIQKQNFTWNSNLVFAYNRTKVTKSYNYDRRSDSFRSGSFDAPMTPIEGYDLFSLLTYKWAGLDPEKGMPLGYLDGEVSNDHFALVYSSKVDDLDNHGSSRPTYFGSLRNSFTYRNLELSFNISYQLGYKFVRTSFYNSFFINNDVGHADYAKRWQKPGDEQWTNVPAFVYPNSSAASDMYLYSSALVERGDQIKLRDIQLSYSLTKLKQIGLKNARVYAYIQNVGTIWRANKRGIDPEYGSNIPDPRYTSFGVNFNL